MQMLNLLVSCLPFYCCANIAVFALYLWVIANSELQQFVKLKNDDQGLKCFLFLSPVCVSVYVQLVQLNKHF